MTIFCENSPLRGSVCAIGFFNQSDIKSSHFGAWLYTMTVRIYAFMRSAEFFTLLARFFGLAKWWCNSEWKNVWRNLAVHPEATQGENWNEAGTDMTTPSASQLETKEIPMPPTMILNIQGMEVSFDLIITAPPRNPASLIITDECRWPHIGFCARYSDDSSAGTEPIFLTHRPRSMCNVLQWKQM